MMPLCVRPLVSPFLVFFIKRTGFIEVCSVSADMERKANYLVLILELLALKGLAN